MRCLLEGERYVIHSTPQQTILTMSSYRCRRNLSPEWIIQTHQRITDRIRFSWQIWKGTGLDWLYCPRCSKCPETISQQFTTTYCPSGILRTVQRTTSPSFQSLDTRQHSATDWSELWSWQSHCNVSKAHYRDTSVKSATFAVYLGSFGSIRFQIWCQSDDVC